MKLTWCSLGLMELPRSQWTYLQQHKCYAAFPNVADLQNPCWKHSLLPLLLILYTKCLFGHLFSINKLIETTLILYPWQKRTSTIICPTKTLCPGMDPIKQVGTVLNKLFSLNIVITERKKVNSNETLAKHQIGSAINCTIRE